MLHDDILPRLHAAMLMLDGQSSPTGDPSADVVALLGDLHREIADLLHDMPATTVPEVARLGVFAALRQAVKHELGSAFDQRGDVPRHDLEQEGHVEVVREVSVLV